MPAMSLRWRGLLSSWLLVATVVGLFALLLYETQRREYLAGIDARLAVGAHAARALAGIDYHDRIVDAGSVDAERYLALVDANNRLCRDAGLQYLWSNLFLPDGRIVFTTATSPDLDSASGGHAPFFSAHSDPAAFAAVRRAGQPTYTSFRNEWGSGRMLLVPYQDSQGRTHVFGASIATDQLDERLAATRRTSIQLFMLMLVLGAIGSLWLSAVTIRPLSRLRKATEAIARGDFAAPVATRGGGEEIEALAASVREMGETIRASQQSRQAMLVTLERERALFKTLYQGIPQLVWLKDKEGVYLACNREFERFFGQPESVIVGKTDHDFVDTAQADFFRAHDAQAMASDEPSVNEEWITYAEDGRRALLRTTKLPLRDVEGELIGVLGIGLDITVERRREDDLTAALAALGERNAELNVIFSLSPDGLVLFDASGRAKIANPAFLAMTGLGEQEIVGSSIDDLDARLRALAESAHAWPGLESCFVARKVGSGETAIDRCLLALREPRASMLAVLGACGAESGIGRVLYVRDVTHETEVDRMKSEFLSHAAHELRTPMASIYGYTELMLAEDFPPETTRDFLATIHRQSELLIAIINELLDLVRIEARRGKDFNLEALDANDLARLAMESFKPPPEHAAPVLHALSRAAPLRGDRNKLLQAIGNVLSNAYKYSPTESPVVIDIAVREASGTEPARVGIGVRDRGIGMTPEQAARVFERFYRADISGKIPGTGLGMSIVKEIVELHGGTVEVLTAPGAGTTVTLWLPASGVPGVSGVPSSTPSKGEDQS